MRRSAAAGQLSAAVLLAAGCTAGTPSASASAPVPGRSASAAQYLSIAEAGNRRLDVDFDRLTGPDADNLSAARADLRDAAATEHLFDRRLAAIAFPPTIEAVARTLFAENEARAELATAAADAPDLQQLHAGEAGLTAANAPVERAVTAIRSRLGLPPPDTG